MPIDILERQNKLPKISVVTPSFNKSEFLEKCICSVLSQNYSNFEYMIIDGGSTDQSLEIIQHYQKQIDYWISEPDAGQSDAINKGLKKCSGDMVAWLNADDFYLPDAFLFMAEAYKKAPSAAFYFGNGWRVNRKGKFKSNFFPDDYLYFNRSSLIYGLNYILQPSTFINHKHLINSGYIDTGLKYGMDTDLWIRLSAEHKPEPVPKFIAASREYNDTKTQTGSFQRVEELRQIAEKFSGVPITPGVLCYFIDTLNNIAQQNRSIYPKHFQDKINEFWSETAKLMVNFNCRQDGFPMSPFTFKESSRKKLLPEWINKMIRMLLKKMEIFK